MTRAARVGLWMAVLVVSSVYDPSGVWAAKSTLLNGTAAQFGNTLLTIEDVYFIRSVQRFKEGVEETVQREEGEALRKAIQKVVFEEVVFTEMKNLQYSGGPSKPEVEKWLAQKNKNPKTAASWKAARSAFGRAENAALERLLRSQQVERFLQKKVDTLTPIITDAEAERYFQQNQTKFKDSTFEKLKPNIVMLLKKERMQKGLEEWIRFLRDKYGVTNYLEG